MLLPSSVFDDFVGVDLRADVLGSPCRSQLNVWIPNDGVLEARPGYTVFSSPTSEPRNIFITPRRVYSVSNASTLEILDQTTGNVDYTSAFGVGTSNVVPHGAPGTTRAYYGAAATTTTIVRIDEVAPSTTSVAAPTCGWLAVTPASNRLVIASYLGPAANRDRVHFSDAGAPETFGANSYIELDPSDGEQFTGAVTWRDLTFVFKYSKFFVFYGESTSGTGTPVFNYRAVRSGQGIPIWSQGNVVAGTDGVYFQAADGIYRTTGGEPQKISSPLDPLFRNGRLDRSASSGLSMFRFNDANRVGKMAWHRGRLFAPLLIDPAAGSGVGSGGLLVWDSRVDRWHVWSMPTSSLASGLAGTASGGLSEQLLFARDQDNGATTGKIYTFGDFAATTDDGTAIAAYYASGFGSFGLPAEEVEVRHAELVGRGDSMSLEWYRDQGATAQSTQTFTVGSGSGFGTSSTMVPGRARLRTAARGGSLSWRLSGNAPWRAQRFVVWPREVRGSGERTA